MSNLKPLNYGNPMLVTLRSEEHTSELQSRQSLVCRLLLEKKNKLARPAHLVAPPRGPEQALVGRDHSHRHRRPTDVQGGRRGPTAELHALRHEQDGAFGID